MNSDEMLKASVNTLSRVKTIDELTKKVIETKREIKMNGETIRDYGKGLLKNMTPKKVKTDIVVKGRWSEQNLVFANYGIGIQNKYNTNATSLAELDWKEFVSACLNLNGNEIYLSLSKYLKPEKLAILKRFLKNVDKLKIDREPQVVEMNKPISYVSRNMLSARGGSHSDFLDSHNAHSQATMERMTKKAELDKVEYHDNKLSFTDKRGDKVKVNVNNPQLEDALILEQIFDETKALLKKEIIRLEKERANYVFFINELKKDFSNELLIMELAK